MLLVLGIWIMDVNGVRGLIITLLLSLRWMVMDVGIGSFLPPPPFCFLFSDYCFSSCFSVYFLFFSIWSCIELASLVSVFSNSSFLSYHCYFAFI